MPLPLRGALGLDGLPRLIYGTAWKEDETGRLTALALEQGFRAVDTANQRKHYFEAGAGAALQAALRSGKISRGELFLQTKFTSPGGQDSRLPYDAGASPREQVRQSFESSLSHLGVDLIDSYLLHGPSQRVGWHPDDLEAWSEMEALQREGKTRFIGVSNVSLEQLSSLCARADVRPAFVQNRCYAARGWDRDVRACCRSHGITYQGFSLLTANQSVLRSVKLRALAAKKKATAAQLVFAYARQVGMQALTGTSDAAHMREDLESARLSLSEEELGLIEAAGEQVA